ncbi:Tn3 family transposase [Deefgea salmonis]|uniref:Tn3 family transposase n=1 Tax=Deefgea salmonis TaxID=2875502 RepID=A0ABS8BH07_9NEIS|nr:Tn3 family transposase [Deefgea salmonis]MCB5194997.1 Tn3 family transposase [Deefgea salmonis]
MPVGFLTQEQRDGFGQYVGSPSREELERYFYLSDEDREVIQKLRGDHSRLGYAILLSTVRFIGGFPDKPMTVPLEVQHVLMRQLSIAEPDCLLRYSDHRRWIHASDIQQRYGYSHFTDHNVGFRLSRWLYALCWTGTDRPSVLFERATTWLLTHKVLLPGVSQLERFVAQLRSRVEERLWHTLGRSVTEQQRQLLLKLLAVEEGNRGSRLDQLRSGPVMVSGPSLVKALLRLDDVRGFGITLPAAAHIPPSRIAALARFANTAKVTAINRLPPARQLATLVAFAVCLEATAHDDALEVLEALLRDIFSNAEKADKKARLRTLKDLDRSAATLAAACKMVLDASIADGTLRNELFASLPRAELEKALEEVNALIRPANDVFLHALEERYRGVRRFLPDLLARLHFGANPTGEAVVAGLEWLHKNLKRKQAESDAPQDVVAKSWKKHIFGKDGELDMRAYVFCVLDELRTALRRRDVYVSPSWRYADPRLGLLDGAEWLAARPIVCRSLGLTIEAKPTLDALTAELDATWLTVAKRLPENSAIQLTETEEGKTELSLGALDKLDEPPSLLQLRAAVADLMPRVDLPEILLEVAARTGFTSAFAHVSERNARADNFATSLCAVLLGDACNTGLEPLIRADIPALRRDRLSWVSQNYIRDDTLAAANAILVSMQSQLELAQAWGGGEVASADGMRFVVPVRTVHSGPNPKYFGSGRGVTWYNMISDQFSGLNAITVPGTLRDSLVLLAVVLEQQTELQPTQIMTDTGAYSDVVFGLFRLLGYHFSPRLADVGGTRFWRSRPDADYGQLNGLAKQSVKLELITEHWDDLLRLAGSLKLGRIPATGIMRTLQTGDRPTRLAQALAEFGRLEKTLHMLTYIDDESKRRATLTQLNRGESRHSLARAVFHGKRGELRQRYREGQEDQLSTLGLVVNMIVLWNTIYMTAALKQLKGQGYPILDADVARLSPLGWEHINMLGRYSFLVPDEVARGELRPLRNPADDL